MGIFDTFKGNQYKKEVEELQAKIQQLTNTFTPEMRNAANIQDLITKLNNDVNIINNVIAQKNNEVSGLNQTISKLNFQISDKKSQIICLDEESIMQEFGLYEPKYDFANSDIYKEKLTTVRTQQKELIKNNRAVTGNMSWSVNGSNARCNRGLRGFA